MPELTCADSGNEKTRKVNATNRRPEKENCIDQIKKHFFSNVLQILCETTNVNRQSYLSKTLIDFA
jgi:hypothetical protein